MYGSVKEAVIKHKDETETKRSVIILELAEKGDLFEYISITKSFPAPFCRAVFEKIFSGL